MCAETLRVEFTTEVQSFYLNPKSSSNLFAKYEFKTAGKYEFTNWLSLKSNAAFNYVQLNPQDQKTFLVNPSDFGFYLTSKFADLNLGGWSFSPEATDINNIFEVIHGRDFRQPFAAENIGSLGALADFHINNFDLKLFYIPKNSRSLLPDTQSPWWPRTDSLPVTGSMGTFYLPDNISYNYRNDTELNRPFENNFGTFAKMSFSFIDLYAFYFLGANQVPKIRPHFTADATSLDPPVATVRSPIDLDLTWFKSEHLGLGFSSSINPVILKTFCKTQKDFLEETISSNSCTFTVESSQNLFKYTVRYFLQANRVWKKNDTAAELKTLLGFFEKSLALGYFFDFNPENSFSGAVVYNEQSPSVLTVARYERKWSDKFKTALSLNVISVGNEPLAKAYDQTDNVSLKFSYGF